jgi:hypothetical protein
MSATITFTATHEGETYTRTSGTMPYVAITVGSQVQWHKSFASAHKAAVSRTQTYRTGVPATVIPAVPTAINGKLGDWTPEVDGWGDIPASAFTELVADKLAGKPAAKPAEDAIKGAQNTLVTAEAPVDEDAAIQAEMDVQAAKRAKAAAAKRRQRAAKKAREAGTFQERLDARVEAAPVPSAEKIAETVERELAAVKAPAKPKGVKAVTEEGKKVWRGSGPAYNAYRRMRHVRLQAEAARAAGEIAKAEELEARQEELRLAWEAVKAQG